MSEETILCKCMICSKENENGLLVSKRTFNRNRKIQQEFLDDDDVEEKDDRSEGCEMGGRGMLFAVLCLSSLTLAEPLGSLAD